MREFDIENIWEENQQEAEAHFDRIEPHFLDMAQKGSNSVVAKFKKKIYIEIIVSFLLLVSIVIPYFSELSPLLIALIVALQIAILLPYRKVLKDIKLIPSLNVVESLELHIKLMNDFLKRLKIVTLLLIPISLLIGFVIGINSGEEPIDFGQLETGKILYAIGGMLLTYFVVALITIKLYIPWLYGSTKKDFEALLSSLKRQE